MTTDPTQKLPLTGVLITHNAASQLQAALESLHFCKELLVVDSGSTDATCELAAQAGARVIHNAWPGFGLQKQFAVAQARFDWVLCLDADERVSPALQDSIRLAMNTQTSQPRLAGFEFARCNFFMGRFLRHGEGYPDYSKRLFNRTRANWSSDAVHEKVEPCAKDFVFKRIDGDLLHLSAETLFQYLEKQNRYTQIQAAELAKQGRGFSGGKMVLSPLVRFIKFYLFKKGFLDGLPGFVHIAIGCFNGMMKYAKLREIQARDKES